MVKKSTSEPERVFPNLGRFISPKALIPPARIGDRDVAQTIKEEKDHRRHEWTFLLLIYAKAAERKGEERGDEEA